MPEEEVGNEKEISKKRSQESRIQNQTISIRHMGREHASREKKLPMVNFLIFVQKNVSTIRFQEIKIRPFGDFEKMRFLCFYIIKSMARKGYFGPKSDFRGSKIPPRGASST